MIPVRSQGSALSDLIIDWNANIGTIKYISHLSDKTISATEILCIPNIFLTVIFLQLFIRHFPPLQLNELISLISSRECYCVGPVDVSPRGASVAGLQQTAQTSGPGITGCTVISCLLATVNG